MEPVDVLAVSATVAGVTMAVSPVLQIRRMLQTGSSTDVSLGYLTLLCVGFMAWLAYGLALGNAAMIISNIASIAVMVATIGVATVIRRRAAGGGAVETADPPASFAPRPAESASPPDAEAASPH